MLIFENFVLKISVPFDSEQGFTKYLFEPFSSRKYSIRIVWKLSQEFEVFESSTPVPIFPGFLVKKKALNDTGAGLGRKGAIFPLVPIF